MKHALAVVLMLLAEARAEAHSVALPEEILCTNDTAVIATVLDARSHDRGRIGVAGASHDIGVTLRIAEVLSPSRGDVHVGDVVSTGLRVVDESALSPGGWGVLGFRITEQPITDATARARLVGKRLVVAMTPLSRMGPRSAAVGEPNDAAAYLPSDEAWVRATWSTPACAHFWTR